MLSRRIFRRLSMGSSSLIALFLLTISSLTHTFISHYLRASKLTVFPSISQRLLTLFRTQYSLQYILSDMSISVELLAIIYLYLTKRRVHIKTPEGISEQYFCPSKGVPQGSHMGPILFNLYINGTFSIFRNIEVLAYADDIKIFTRVTSPVDSAALKSAIDAFSARTSDHSLSIYATKTQLISFHKSTRPPTLLVYKLGNSSIPRVYLLKDLGVFFDSNLHFSHHLAHITTRFNQSLAYSGRWVSALKNTTCKTAFYLSFILPILEFDQICWISDNDTVVDTLETFQRRFTRHILGIPPVSIRFKFNFLFTIQTL